MSVFSRNWFLVEKLKPRLKPQVEISPQRQRGEVNYALREPVSANIQLYTEQAYTFIGLLDGERDLQQVWQQVCETLGDEMPTQEDVISLIASLYQMDMLYLNLPANAADLLRRCNEKKEKKIMQKAYSPMSVQIPLFDPTRLLDKLCPLLDKMLKPYLWFVYAAVVVFGVMVALQNYQALTENAADRILSADNLLLLWFLYPLIKIIHEFGHAYAVRRYGGQVHEVGVMFLVFFPMPYVNASESAAFSDKYQRMLVAAAGLIVELFIAAIAIILWSMASDGLTKSILYNVAFMAGVSTVLFNGNPLLKFDAYYVLSDFLEIPNLAKKSVSYWGYLCKRYVFRFRDPEIISRDVAEKYWLFFYNLFSFVYRVFISIAIVLFVGSQYFVVGVILGVWTLASSWVVPFVKTFSKPFTEPQFLMLGKHPKKIMLVVAIALWFFMCALPMPHTYTTSGVSWVKDSERLYATESGFVERVEVPSDGLVQAGDSIVFLRNYTMQDRLAEISGQLSEARARLRSVYSDRSKSGMAVAELKRFQDEKRDLELSIANARVTAHSSGRVVIADQQSLLGRFLQRGEIVGYVLNPDSPLTVKVIVSEEEAEQVMENLQSVILRPASQRNVEITATMVNVVPRVGKEIPSPVLFVAGGGEVVADPSAKDGMQALENFVVLEVQVPGRPMDYIFERFYVQFELPPQPFVQRLYRQIRQVFIEQFDV